MTEAKNLQRLVIVLVFLFLGACTSILLQVFVLQEEDAIVYGSDSYFTIASPVSQNESGQLREKQLSDFAGIVIETLESDEMDRRALERVRVTHPALVSCEVHTKVSSLKVQAEDSRFKDVDFFKVMATGKEPEFIRVFLDTLIDEFIAFRKVDALEVPVIEELASHPAKVLGDWQEAAISGAATGGSAGLIAGLMLAWTLVRPERDAAQASEQNTPSDPAASRSNFMRNHRILVWGVAFGMVSGLLIQIVRLTNRPQEFRSIAKVAAIQGPGSKETSTSKVSHGYDGEIIEILESAQLQSKAMKRVKVQNPELKILDASIRVSQTKGRAIFNVLATSSEPKFTRLFLDALLDEFMILHMRRAEDAGQRLGQDVSIQEGATPASENVESWGMLLYLGAVAGALLGGLLGLLGKLVSRAATKPDLQTA